MTIRAAACPLVVVGLLMTACGSSGGGASTTSAPAVTTLPAGEVLASYIRSGGVAGQRFQVVVLPDGSFEGGSGKMGRGHLGGSALEELRRLVAAFVAAAPGPTYGRAVPDGFTTSVMAAGASTSILSGGDPPPAVAELVTFLGGLERQLPR